MAGALSYRRGDCLPQLGTHLGTRVTGFVVVSIVLLVMVHMGVNPKVAAGTIVTLVFASGRLLRR